MQVQDVTAFARILQAEPNVGQRFPDSQLISMTDRAQKFVVRALRWPESRYLSTTAALVQEYQLPEAIRVLRVQINGESLRRTDIPTMEGQQIGLPNDSGRVAGAGGGLIAPGVAPFTTGSGYGPAWQATPPAAYPVTAGAGSISSPAAPWFIGARPCYYMRGGNIGFVPAPIAPYTYVVDMIAQPATLVNLQDACVLPDITLDALAWKVSELMAFSDEGSNPGESSSRDYAQTMFRQAMGDLQSWRKSLDGVGSRGPNILGLRVFYRGRGQHRNSNGRGEY